MPLPDKQKIDKLIGRIHALLNTLETGKRDFAIYRCIDPYYYIRKVEELRGIHETELRHRLGSETVVNHYRDIYRQWSKDVRWLNKHLLFNLPCLQLLPYHVAD